ncbi:DUF4365 domain-containing protein [Amycolatopsis sp. NPDC021455]|uniref:DUF4365 domain-containing protein n=1 Tax=Amycolatopsis sp. NPDC021455 TaxID=3154901 RepID=UPI0033CA719A
MIGSKAAAAVSRIWLEIDAAVDEVRNDYGEDLLVQTSLRGEVDPSRIWVQVKGRLHIDPDAFKRKSVRVPIDRAIRWAYSAETVVVVLWDVSADRGWFTYPRMQVDPIELLLSDKQSVALKFEESAIFDQAAATSIAWEARIEHSFGRYLVAMDNYSTAEKFGNKGDSQQPYRAASFALYDLLCKVQIVTDGDDILPKKFMTMLKNGYKHPWEEPLPPEDRFFYALQLIVIGHFQEVTGSGLPTALAEGTANFVANMILSGRSVLEWAQDEGLS